MVGTTDLGRCYADGRAAEVVARANAAYHSLTAADMRTPKAPAANAAARGNALYGSAADVYPAETAWSNEVDRATAVFDSNTLFSIATKPLPRSHFLFRLCQ